MYLPYSFHVTQELKTPRLALMSNRSFVNFYFQSQSAVCCSSHSAVKKRVFSEVKHELFMSENLAEDEHWSLSSVSDVQ